MRHILLIEPKYKNKYPPIGLMKISTYHKQLGDQVEFYKGDLKDLVVEKLTERCVMDISNVLPDFAGNQAAKIIRKIIRQRKDASIEDLGLDESSKDKITSILRYYSDIFKKKKYDLFPKWDRIYVTTLFTFYWKVTIEAIHFAKHLVTNNNRIWVGGVLASLLHNEVEVETGVKPHQGLLDQPGMLDPDIPEAHNFVIDNLTLDYSILEEIDYVYPTGSAYFTFMTKGCTRKCAFCSVPILEPGYKPKIPTLEKFMDVKERFGEQQHLLLMDNNVLASPQFPEIIEEIKAMGFYKGAMFVEPNQLDIAAKNLKDGINDKAYIRKTFALITGFSKNLKASRKEHHLNVLHEYQLDNFENVTKENLLLAYEAVADTYERYRSKIPRHRYVDFNQGTDARYVTDELMKLMSEIPIRPLRIAFDYWSMREKYEAAVRLAAKYKITELSNYILYNFKDTPEELYRRLEINVLLGEELGIHIYSFPMKYIPLFGEEAKDRNFIGVKWNKKFIRAIQSILNVTKGIVAPGRSFFQRAFGSTLEEFFELLYMPETYIIYRSFFEECGLTKQWRDIYYSLSDEERQRANEMIISNSFSAVETYNTRISDLLKHYLIKKEDLNDVDLKDRDHQKTKLFFQKLIRDDRFKDLTLTYDYETSHKRDLIKIAI